MSLKLAIGDFKPSNSKMIYGVFVSLRLVVGDFKPSIHKWSVFVFLKLVSF